MIPRLRYDQFKEPRHVSNLPPKARTQISLPSRFTGHSHGYGPTHSCGWLHLDCQIWAPTAAPAKRPVAIFGAFLPNSLALKSARGELASRASPKMADPYEDSCGLMRALLPGNEVR